MTGKPRRRGGAKARRAARARRAAARARTPGAGKRGTSASAASGKGAGRTLMIACGALASEIMVLKRQLGFDTLDVHCLPAAWHNAPQHIPEGVRGRIRQAREEGYERVFVAYADCGTGGALDAVLAEEGVERLPGTHCYAFLSGVETFMSRLEEDARSFFLTDYLVRHFDALVWKGLMLDEHPELKEQYFGNYEKLVHLAQREDAELAEKARRAADRLGLAFEYRFSGHGDLERAMRRLAENRHPSTRS